LGENVGLFCENIGSSAVMLSLTWWQREGEGEGEEAEEEGEGEGEQEEKGEGKEK